MRMMPPEPEWMDPEVILAIHSEQIAEHGGTDGIRDPGLLDSALNRPLQLWSYVTPAPDLCSLAAAYAFGVAKNHPFLDGNKRVAAVICETFLLINGLRVTLGEVEKYPHYLALASGEHTEESFALWLRNHTAPLS